MRQTISFSVATLLFFYGCKKPNVQRNLSPATSSLLIEANWSGPSTNGQDITFSYNSNNQVSQIRNAEWYSFSYNGGSYQIGYDTSYITFAYTNGLVTKAWGNQFASGYAYERYEYNDRQLLIKKTSYDRVAIGGDSASPIFKSDVPVRIFDCNYDNHDNIIQIIDSSPADVNSTYPTNTNYTFVFNYNDSNDLTSLTSNEYAGNVSPVRKYKYDYSNFDNKINYIKAINGLPPTDGWDNNFGGYSSSSPNNILTEAYYIQTDPNQPFVALQMPIIYTYEYNDEGLPISMYYAGWKVTFTYKKL
jgi:hypothetical protein